MKEGKEACLKEGKARMRKLQSILVNDKHYDNLERSAEDDSYCENRSSLEKQIPPCWNSAIDN